MQVLLGLQVCLCLKSNSVQYGCSPDDEGSDIQPLIPLNSIMCCKKDLKTKRNETKKRASLDEQNVWSRPGQRPQEPCTTKYWFRHTDGLKTKKAKKKWGWGGGGGSLALVLRQGILVKGLCAVQHPQRAKIRPAALSLQNTPC